MNDSGYKTLASSAQDEFTVQKSRFIGYAAPVDTQEAALDFIRQIKEKHRDASHHCYAYVIGRNAGVMRYQDDGEPSGTAGQPIMEVLKQQGLVNCCCVVVRYFGGILLGAGGLTRAYSKGCSIAVAAAGTAMMEESLRIALSIPYPLWDKLQHHLPSLPVQMMSAEYADQVTAIIVVRQKDSENTQKAITEFSDGRISMSIDQNSFYYSWNNA